MKPETTALVAKGAVTKGDVLAVARVAGIQAAKRTSDLIPLCHPLLVGSVYVNFRIEDRYIEVEAQVETVVILVPEAEGAPLRLLRRAAGELVALHGHLLGLEARWGRTSRG
jgi:hypothetical protein